MHVYLPLYRVGQLYFAPRHFIAMKRRGQNIVGPPCMLSAEYKMAGESSVKATYDIGIGAYTVGFAYLQK